MASATTSMRRLVFQAVLYTPCRAVAKTCAPRLFSILGPLRAELNAGSQGAGTQVQAIERGKLPGGGAQAQAMGRKDQGDRESHVEKDWEFDDFSSMAHSELERHREARQYARITAYEMPRLSELVKQFQPPTEKQVLRFRYTTYMGEKHPAESKVVCEFATIDLGLAPPERLKLIKLVGVRYNPETDIVRMSCEMFEHQAQNKRYLSDLVDTLMNEAKDSTDTFEDVPLDFRHHEAKKGPPKPQFPKEWRLTSNRRRKLAKARAKLETAFQ